MAVFHLTETHRLGKGNTPLLMRPGWSLLFLKAQLLIHSVTHGAKASGVESGIDCSHRLYGDDIGIAMGREDSRPDATLALVQEGIVTEKTE